MGWLNTGPDHLAPWNDPVPVVKDAGSQHRSGRMRKSSLLPIFDSWIIKALAIRYTDQAVQAHIIYSDNIIIYEEKNITENFVT
jgi:hypothetical protein